MKKERFQNSTTHLIVDGHNALRIILSSIRYAKKSIHIKMFMWREDELGRRVLQALEDKILEHPAIRVIIEKDIFGSRVYNWQRILSLGKKRGDIFSSEYGENFLRNYKEQVTFVRIGSKTLLLFKLLKENDHSKVFVFDEKTPHVSALVGGMNIGNEYLSAPNQQEPDAGGWHDYMLHIHGELANHLLKPVSKKRRPWALKTLGQGMEILLNLKSRRQMKRYMVRELKQAQESVIVEHGYLTDDNIIRRLRRIARKGVRVTVIVPDRSDGVYHANMQTIDKLLQPGLIRRRQSSPVRVYLYPGMIHAKVIIIDSETTIIGSANLTSNSFDYLNETNAIIRKKKGITRALLTQIKKDVARSTRLSRDTVPKYNRFLAAIQKIFI